MPKCKFCPRSEISLRRDSFAVNKNLSARLRWCTHFKKHVQPHRKTECEVGDAVIKEEGARKLYPFT